MSSDFHLYYDGDSDEDTHKNKQTKQNMEDEDFKKAIQLSLQHPQPQYYKLASDNNKSKEKAQIKSNKKNIIDIDEEEQDSDLKQAILNSLHDSPSPSPSSSSSSYAAAFASTTSTSTSSSPPKEKPKRGPTEWAWYLNKLPGGFPKEANSASISIRDIIIPEGLEAALITTYELEMEWLLRQVPILSSVPVTMVHGEKHPEGLPRPPASMTYHKPNLPLQWGVHHGKMFVLYYPHFVRVAISTANLIMIDYEKKSQGIWMQDFPKKDPKQKYTVSDFESTLVDYVTRLGVNTSRIQQYDYSIANVVLITSIPGYHKGNYLNKYGHMKLRTALQNEKMSPQFKNAPVACQFSSTGSLSKEWLVDELLGTLTSNGGFHGDNEADEKSKKKEIVPTISTKKDKKRPRDDRDLPPNLMKIIWPTVDFVRNSIDGYSSGGSLCFPAKNFKGFFQELNLFHSYISFKGRDHVPPHIKTYSRYLDDGELAWSYLTSSNLSKAAMGELQKGGTQLMIRHYEIGVLFLPSIYYLGQKEPPRFFTQQYFHNLEQSNSTPHPCSVGIPLPYMLPPNVYTNKDAPWLWDVPQSAPDVFGKRWLC